ncbi:MAG TPA: hypothetical protein VFM16_05675, partial [Holophagaceae bacterium]|nr:hypothetical protein [Holophagaceae bacterium]
TAHFLRIIRLNGGLHFLYAGFAKIQDRQKPVAFMLEAHQSPSDDPVIHRSTLGSQAPAHLN